MLPTMTPIMTPRYVEDALVMSMQFLEISGIHPQMSRKNGIMLISQNTVDGIFTLFMSIN